MFSWKIGQVLSVIAQCTVKCTSLYKKGTLCTMYIVQYRKHKTEKNNNVKNWNKERYDCVKTQLIINKWLHTE